MPSVDLTVLLPVLNERDNITQLLPRTEAVLATIGCSYELLVVDGGSIDGTADAATAAGARVIRQTLPGYGGALREGFAASRGRYILTLDADLSHDPDFIAKLWRGRTRADVIIASRYVRGGVAYMPRHRLLLSRVLNRFFARRARPAPPRPVERLPALSPPRRSRPRARGHQLRGPRGDPGEGARGRMAHHRDRVHVLSARARHVARSHHSVRASRCCARSSGSGSCETRSSRQTTTSGHSTASSRCNAGGSGDATRSSAPGRAEPARPSTSAAARA